MLDNERAWRALLLGSGCVSHIFPESPGLPKCVPEIQLDNEAMGRVHSQHRIHWASRDPEQNNNSAAADLFREVQQQNKRVAAQAEQLLAERLGK